MIKGGYTGKILRVNLSNRTYNIEDTPKDIAKRFIGGAGFGIKYLFDEVSPDIDPLTPENKLIYASGPFSGTSVPCSSRMAVTAKSPLTGAVGMGLSGGHFPVELKFAGYDALIVEGKAERPVYLWINDDKVKFRPAKKVWGTRTSDCQQIIKDNLKDQNIRIACIGPAGENLVRIACIINERRAVGRKGLGAVMGAKNLKAIAIRGNKSVPIADKNGFNKAKKKMFTAMKNSDVLYPSFAKTGTPSNVDLTSEMGIFPTKNWSTTGKWAPVEGLGLKANKEKEIGKEHCYDCPVGCSKLKIADSGPYKGILTEGPEFESLYSLGGQTGVDVLNSVIAADRICDELGIDTISAGVVIGFAMELYEKGIITNKETNGLEIKFGNDQVMIQLLNNIAYRQGLGDLLAEGVKNAAREIGKDTDKYAVHVKGLELPGYDVRGAKAHGLNYATSYTGGDHNRGYAFQEIFGIPVPRPVDRFETKGKGELTKWNQDIRAAACDSATMCGFILDTALAGIADQNTADILEPLTGIAFSPADILTAGERINNLARMFNILAGFGRKDDTLPERVLTEPLPGGNSKGHYIDREELDEMLDEYYQARGWSKKGIPTEEKLLQLELNSEAETFKEKSGND